MGVGASMASGSHVCSGIWADLAEAATRRKTKTTPMAAGGSLAMAEKSKLFSRPYTMPTEEKRKAPPTCVMTRALKPAFTATGRPVWWEMRSQEQRVVHSQKKKRRVSFQPTRRPPWSR